MIDQSVTLTKGGGIITKKQDLKDTALRIFSENGYHLTSIQQIAKETGISKGAFYRHFESKEQLFTELIEDHHAAILATIRKTSSTDASSKSQLLIKQIESELEHAHQNRSFLLTIFNEFPPKKGNELTALMEQFRIDLLSIHRKMLQATYGNVVEHILCDLIVTLEGMMREYMSIIIFHDVKISVADLSVYIVSCLDALVDARDHLQPILTGNDLFNGENQQFSKQETREQLFRNLQHSIHHLPITGEQKHKYHDAVTELQALENSKENQYLIEALVSYLKKEQGLVSNIHQLEKIFS